jgi:hypothetical protein
MFVSQTNVSRAVNGRRGYCTQRMTLLKTDIRAEIHIPNRPRI